MSSAAISDDFERIATTGEWWVDPWWEAPNCEIHFPVPIERVRRSAEALRRHFDAESYKRLAAEPRKNLVFPYLCLNRSSWALSFIASFGETLDRLKDADGLNRPLRVLRDFDGESAFLELEAAGGFAEMGYFMSFPREGGPKSPDIIAVRDKLQIAIECKRLGDEEWEDWEETLMREISFFLPYRHEGRDVVVQVALNPRLSEIRLGSEGNSPLNIAFSGAIKQAIFREINAALASFSPPHDISIPEIAHLHFDWKTPESYGSVSGMERSTAAIFRRIFQNGLLRALEQLPPNYPGVVVIYSKYAPDISFFRLLFDAACGSDPGRFSDLTAVVICSLQTVFRSTAPTIFRNRLSPYTEAADAVKKTFLTTFRAIEG